MDKILQIKNLEIAFGAKPLFSGLDASLQAGETLAVLGCNGAGKSSFLKTLALAQNQQKGEISFGNKKICTANIGYLPQENFIRREIPINVLEYVALARINNSKLKDSEIKQLLIRLGLEDLIYSQISELSGGQFIMARIARLALMNAPILILDEPFASLDNEKSFLLLDLIKEWKAQGKIIIISIHDERLAQGFDHFVTFDGENHYWERKNAPHNHNCALAHQIAAQ